MRRMVKIELILFIRCFIMFVVGLFLSLILGESIRSALRFSGIFALTFFVLFNFIMLFLPRIWAKLKPVILR